MPDERDRSWFAADAALRSPQPDEAAASYERAASALTSEKAYNQRGMETLGVPVTPEEYAFISAAAAAAPDPEAELDRWGAALQFARFHGISYTEAYANLEGLTQNLLGQAELPKNGALVIRDYLQRGFVGVEDGDLGWKLMQGVDDPAEVERIWNRHREIQQFYQSTEDKIPRHWLVEVLKAGAAATPFSLEVMRSGALGSLVVGGTAAGMLAATAATAATAGVAAPLTVPAAAALVASMSAAGGTAGSTERGRQIVAGQEYFRMLEAGVKPEVARVVSDLSGILQSALESTLGNVPAVLGKATGSAVGGLTQEIMKRLIIKGHTGRLARGLMEFGGNVLEEGMLEETFQSVSGDIMFNIAAVLSDNGVDQITANEIAKNAWESGKQGTVAALTLSIPGALTWYNTDVQGARYLATRAKRQTQADFVAGNQDSPVLEKLQPEAKTDALRQIWEAANTKAAEKTEAKPEAKPSERSVETIEQEIAAKKDAASKIDPVSDTQAAIRAEAEVQALEEELKAKRAEESPAPEKPSSMTRAEYQAQRKEEQQTVRPPDTSVRAWTEEPSPVSVELDAEQQRQGRDSLAAAPEVEDAQPDDAITFSFRKAEGVGRGKGWYWLATRGDREIAGGNDWFPSEKAAREAAREWAAAQAPAPGTATPAKAAPDPAKVERDTIQHFNEVTGLRINEVPNKQMRAAMQYAAEQRAADPNKAGQPSFSWFAPRRLMRDLRDYLASGAAKGETFGRFITDQKGNERYDSPAGSITFVKDKRGNVIRLRYATMTRGAWDAMSEQDRARVVQLYGEEPFVAEAEATPEVPAQNTATGNEEPANDEPVDPEETGEVELTTITSGLFGTFRPRDATLNPADIKLSKDIPQRKGSGRHGKRVTQVDARTGVVEVEGESQRIEGFDPLTAPQIIVWERNDGTYEVITGRHRLEAAQREGVPLVRVQIFREADGFTADDGKLLDFVANLRDEKLSVEDAVDFFELLLANRPDFTEAEARRNGLLSGRAGTSAWAIAHDATPHLRQSWETRDISGHRAGAIARGAPGDASTQALAMQHAKEYPDTIEGRKGLELLARRLVELKNEEASQQGLGLDEDAGQAEAAVKMDLAVQKRKRELSASLQVAQKILTLTVGKAKTAGEKFKVTADVAEAAIAKRRAAAELHAWNMGDGKYWTSWILNRRARELAGLNLKDLSGAEQAEYDAFWDDINNQGPPPGGSGDIEAELFGGTREDGESYVVSKEDPESIDRRLRQLMADHSGLAPVVTLAKPSKVDQGRLEVHSLWSKLESFSVKELVEFLDALNKFADAARLPIDLRLDARVWASNSAGLRQTLKVFGYKDSSQRRQQGGSQMYRSYDVGGVMKDSIEEWTLAEIVARLPVAPLGGADVDAWTGSTFGLTDNPEAASFILANGKMLGWNAEEYAKRLERPSHSLGLDLEGVHNHMANTGAIRFDFKNGVVHAVALPTQAQVDTIADAFRGRSEIRVEASLANGETLAWADVTSPTPRKLARVLGTQPFIGEKEGGDQLELGLGNEVDAAFGGEERAEAAAASVQLDFVFEDGRKVDASGRTKWTDSEGYSPVAGQFRKRRLIDFKGLFVPNVRAIAEAFSIYRSQAMETAHIVYVQKGNVIHNEAWSSGAQTYVAMYSTSNAKRFFNHIRRTLNRYGADSFYIVHNHPSGKTDPSTDDNGMAERLSGFSEFKGSIILNGEQFSFTRVTADGTTTEKLDYTRTDAQQDRLEEISERPRANSPDVVAAIWKTLQKGTAKAVAVIVNSQLRVLSWRRILDPERFGSTTAQDWVRKAGGERMIVVTDDPQIWRSQAERMSTEQMLRGGYQYVVDDVVGVLVDRRGPVIASAAAMGWIDQDRTGEAIQGRLAPPIRLGEEGEDYQPGLDPDEHEEYVRNDVLTGEWVPDKVLDDYLHREWAKREYERREELRADIAAYQDAGMFVDGEAEYAEMMAMGDIEGRGQAYYKALWRSSGDRPNLTKAGERFVAALSREQATSVLYDLGAAHLFDALDPETRNSLQDRLAALPDVILDAIAEVQRDGSLGEESYRNLMDELRKDPQKYRFELGGLAATLDAKSAERQHLEEAEVDPDAASFEELQKAYRTAAATNVELQGTIGQMLEHQRNLSKIVLQDEQELAREKAANIAKKYIDKMVRRITRTATSAIATAERKQIVAIQQGFVISGAKAVRAVREKILAILKADPRKSISGAAEQLAKMRFLDQMSLDELEQVFYVTENLRKIGRLHRAQQVAANIQRRAAMAKGVLSTVKAAHGKKAAIIGGSREDQARSRGTPGETANWIIARPSRWARFLDGGEEGINYGILIQRERDARMEFSRNEDRRMGAFKEKMKELGIKQDDWNKVIEVQGERLTQADVLGVYLYMQNEDSALAVMHGNLRAVEDKEGAIDEILSHLTPNQRALGDWMLESFQGLDKERLMSFVEETLNQAFTEVEAYFPMIRLSEGRDTTPDQDVAADMLGRSGVRSIYPARGFTKKRHKILPESQTKIRLNAIQVYFDAIAKQEHLMAYQELVADLRAVYGRKDVKEAVRQKFSGKGVEVIHRYIQRVANPDSIHYADSPADRAYRGLRGNLQMAALAWNVVVWARNMPIVGAWLYLRDAGPWNIIRGLAKVATNGKELERFIVERDPTVATRMSDPYLWQLKQQSASGYQSIVKKVGWAGLRMLEILDKRTVLSGWIATYDMMMEQRDENGEHKFSEQQAIEAAQRATLETQPTGHAADMSELLDSNIGRHLTLFGNQLSQMLNMMLYDMPLDIRRKRADRVLGMLGGFLITGVLMGIIKRKRLPDEPEELALDVASQFLSPTIVGDEVIAFLTGHGYYGSRTPWASAITQAGRAGKALFNDDLETNEKVRAVLRVLPEAARLWGLPTVAIGRVVDAAALGDPWELVGGGPEAREE